MRAPSAEWDEALKTKLNANSAYTEAAVAWEGAILLLILPDRLNPTGEGVYLDLRHGKCLKSRYLPDASNVESEFVFQASRENWRRLLRQELDPVRALLDGTFHVRGNLAKLMRFTRAAKELVETAAAIPAEI
jgi:putative sterol carrier protein